MTSAPSAERSLAGEAARLRQEMLRLQGGGDPFAAAVRGTTLAMAISDPRQDDNPVVFVNDAFLRLTGYRRDEVIGRNCRFLQGPDSDPCVVERIRVALSAAQAIETDIRNHRKDGTPFWNRLMIAPVFDASGKLSFFFANQRDVTVELEHAETRAAFDPQATELADRKEAQPLQELSAGSLWLATEAAEIGIWEFDIASDTLTLSDRIRRMFGLLPSAAATYAELQGHIHPQDRPAVAAAFTASIDPDVRAPYDVEFRVTRADDQELRWVAMRGKGLFDEQGHCRRALGIVMDVTDRRAAESRRSSPPIGHQREREA